MDYCRSKIAKKLRSEYEMVYMPLNTPALFLEGKYKGHTMLEVVDHLVKVKGKLERTYDITFFMDGSPWIFSEGPYEGMEPYLASFIADPIA